MKPAYPAIARDLSFLSPWLAKRGLQALWQQSRAQWTDPLRRFASTGWLAEQLGVDGALIESATIEEIHSGTATRSCLHIRYAEHGDAPPGPTSLFIKSRPPGFGAALFGALFDLGGNEVSFYRHVRPELPVQAPHVYFCHGDSQSYVMLLEDLTAAGCRFFDLTSKCSLEEATRIVTMLAELHARFWQSDRFASDLAWLKRFETRYADHLTDLVRQLSVPITWRKFGHLLPGSMREIMPRLLDVYPTLERHWAQEPRTLIHGDAHLGNMYFRDGVPGLFDWQVVQRGQGMRDVTYFLINSLSEALRLAHQEQLIRHYLATLGDLGVALDFDTAWRQYRLQSVYAWTAPVVTAPSSFQGERVVVAGLTRACKALIDLDVMALIAEL